MPIAGKKYGVIKFISISPHDDNYLVLNRDVLIGRIEEWREGNTEQVDIYICYYFNGNRFIRTRDCESKNDAVRTIRRDRAAFLKLKLKD